MKNVLTYAVATVLSIGFFIVLDIVILSAKGLSFIYGG